MHSRFGLILLLLAAAPLGWSQNAAKAKQLEAVQPKGFPMKAKSTVKGKVSVDAVLLPARVSQRVFGREIATQYAAVELTISNRSRDASFILHSVVLDYSEWLMGGLSPDTNSKTEDTK